MYRREADGSAEGGRGVGEFRRSYPQGVVGTFRECCRRDTIGIEFSVPFAGPLVKSLLSGLVLLERGGPGLVLASDRCPQVFRSPKMAQLS